MNLSQIHTETHEHTNTIHPDRHPALLKKHQRSMNLHLDGQSFALPLSLFFHSLFSCSLRTDIKQREKKRIRERQSGIDSVSDIPRSQQFNWNQRAEELWEVLTLSVPIEQQSKAKNECQNYMVGAFMLVLCGLTDYNSVPRMWHTAINKVGESSQILCSNKTCFVKMFYPV